MLQDLLAKLKKRQRSGSKPRCHLLTHGPREKVAERLTRLVEPWGRVTASDSWMPRGFEDVDEAELDRATALLDESKLQQLRAWWLAVPSALSKTPNIDLSFTCLIGGEKGLALVEAKAHEGELTKEESGKRLRPPISPGSRRNHVRIGACIDEANLALSAETKSPWSLSRDWNYQMSNRFAWAWKLTELGVPVIVLYLGFLNAEEMSEKGKVVLRDPRRWEHLVRSHSDGLFRTDFWGQRLTVHQRALVPLIGAIELPLLPDSDY